MANQRFTDTANPQCGTTQWKVASGTIDIGKYADVTAGELTRLSTGSFTITAASSNVTPPARLWRLPS